MKLKPIQPKTAVHCTSKEQIQYFDKHFSVPLSPYHSDVWIGYGNISNLASNEYTWGWVDGDSSKIYKESGYALIDFTDLIIPDNTSVDEISAKELFDIISKIHKESYRKYNGCIGCPIAITTQNCDVDCFAENAREIIETCVAWQVEHELAKSKQELEAGFVCDDGYFTKDQSDAEEHCKQLTANNSDSNYIACYCKGWRKKK